MSLRQNIYGDNFKKLETICDENYEETWTSEVRLANTAYTRRNALPTHQDDSLTVTNESTRMNIKNMSTYNDI